jgi:hypothetical protein
MLGAAQCAMARDAPLLFIPRDAKRQRLVRTTIDSWQDATAGGAAPTKWTKIWNRRDLKKRCPANEDRAVSGLSTLEASNRELRHPLPVTPRDRLAPVVVFAVSRGPRYSPDVAIGLALAAHMAAADKGVSLIVAPRYLEADSELEDQLRNQRELVKGGVVLGSTGILPEDTQALLRQLLTSTDQEGVLGQVQTNLGEIGPLITIVLTLLGLGTAVRVAPEIVNQIDILAQLSGLRKPPPPTEPAGAGPPPTGPAGAEPAGAEPPPTEPPPTEPPGAQPAGTGPPPTETAGAQPPPTGPPPTGPPAIRGIAVTTDSRDQPPNPESLTQAKSDWLKVLGAEINQEVTVWLRSGWTVTGTADDRNSALTVFRLNGATLAEGKPPQGPPADQTARSNLSVLVPVEDIVWITVGPPFTTLEAG